MNPSSFQTFGMTLYGNANVMNDGTQGNNGAFEAGSGWDAATGLESRTATRLPPYSRAKPFLDAAL